MVDSLGGVDGGSGSAHHQRLETSTVAPLAGANGDSGAPTINVKNINGEPPGGY
jgi:hypothetical protein